MSTNVNKSAPVDLVETLMLGAQLYYPPILVILGSIGNFLSVCIFFCTKMRRSSSSFYLAALAISDTGFLASLLVVWLNLVGIGIFNRPGYCQFFVYLPTLCSFLSVWYVVAFTVERFIAVRYPLRRQSMCTIARAKTILTGLTLLGLVLCSPVLWFSSPRPSGNRFVNVTVCNLAEEWESWASVFNVADTLLTFVLPFTVIAVLNGLIVKSVWRLARVRRSMRTNTGSRKTVRTSSSQSIPRATTVSQTKVTKMLLVVSSVFLCFNLPAYVMRVHAFVKANEEAPRATVIIQHVSNLLFDTNFGINFALYCASGQNFRKAVLRMILRHTRSRRELEPRASLRTNQFGFELTRSTSSKTRQRTIVLEMPWDGNYKLPELSRSDDFQRTTYLIRQSSRENE